MRRLRILCMTALFTAMLAAVEFSFAYALASENSFPLFHKCGTILSKAGSAACLIGSSVATQHAFLDPAAIAPCGRAHLTGTTRAFVARPRASVLSARHELPTDGPAGPTAFIVSVNTPSRDVVLSAEAPLHRPHLSAGRARSAVAGSRTRMRTLPGYDASSPASLPTRKGG